MSRFAAAFCAAILCACIVSAAPRIVYTKSFPGSMPAFVSIALDQTGKTEYKESQDDDPETFQLEPEVTARIFDLAQHLDHFKHPLESGLKLASMGAKTFRWEDGQDVNEVKFNYSTEEDAKALWDWFERIAESERETAVLQRAIRHDKLGVDAAINSVQALWDRKRLVGTAQVLPLLDEVAKEEKYMHMSREHAIGLAEAIRASGHGAVQKGNE